jgi:response regulator RpfG family c-di-GMP phosphodiesterase
MVGGITKDMDTDGAHNTAVVIGDHHGAAMKKLSSTLRKAGFVVVAASNGGAALECCRRERLPVSLAVIDTAAAGIQPPEVEHQLYEMYPDIKCCSSPTTTLRRFTKTNRSDMFAGSCENHTGVRGYWDACWR